MPLPLPFPSFRPLSLPDRDAHHAVRLSSPCPSLPLPSPRPPHFPSLGIQPIPLPQPASASAT
eukprot:1030647-Prorocentrum_lima.AAC.1